MLKNIFERIEGFFDKLSLPWFLVFLVLLSGLFFAGIFRLLYKERHSLCELCPDAPPALYDSLVTDITYELLLTAGAFVIVFILIVVLMTYYFAYSRGHKRITQLQQYTENILYNINRGVIGIDSDGMVIMINREGKRILGQDTGELEGHHFMECIKPREPVSSFLLDALKSGREYRDHDMTYENARGDTFPMRVDTFALRKENGDIVGVVLLAKDLTGEKIDEERMRRADRLSVVARLGQRMAHEIRNPLSAMDINLQLLIEAVERPGNALPGDKILQYAQVVYTELRRLDELLENFFNFSRPTKQHIERVNINVILGDIVQLLDPEAREQGVDINFSPGAEQATLEADKNKLKQAFLNVILNGIQAQPSGGTIRIETMQEENEPAMIRVEILDSGGGIPLENMDNIFDIYFTTKKGGSGLGLSIAHQIIHEHGGTIDAVSWLGDGSLFSIRLPLEENGRYAGDKNQTMSGDDHGENTHTHRR